VCHADVLRDVERRANTQQGDGDLTFGLHLLRGG
jgi:hypothetical protein